MYRRLLKNDNTNCLNKITFVKNAYNKLNKKEREDVENSNYRQIFQYCLNRWKGNVISSKLYTHGKK